jgi:MFS superfamily sulfate permease-like transporter
MQPERKKPGLAARYMPILHWLPRYNKAWLSGDIVAGLSVWALMVPQCLGFAAICGVPVQYGLYAAATALIVYAFFASSHHVVTGPSSTIAAVTGAAVLLVAKAGSSEAIALVAAITLLAGILYIILSVLRMGWISNFLAESVLVGFSESLAAARQYASKYHYDIDVNYLELEGCDMLKEIAENMKSIGIEIHLARVKHGVMDMLEKDGVDKSIGRDHIHTKIMDAVQGFIQKDIPLTKKDP